MSIVKDILEEEKNRLIELRNQLVDEIAHHPKGSISIKKRGNKNYCYQVFRKGKRIIFRYLGKDNSDKVIFLKEQIQKRKNLEQRLKQIKQNLKEVLRGLGEKQQ